MLKHKISVISLGEEYCIAYVGALLVIDGNSGLSLLGFCCGCFWQVNATLMQKIDA
jgi:hypothetical protein